MMRRKRQSARADLGRATMMAITTAVVLQVGCQGDFSTEVSIPKIAIQEAVDAWLPVDSTDYIAGETPAQVMLARAVVVLKEGSDKIGFTLEITVAVPEVVLPDGVAPFPQPAPFAEPARMMKARQQDGSILAFVGIRYEPAEGAFYCEDPSTEEFKFGDMPKELSTAACRITEQLMGKYFSENAVYHLDDEQTMTHLARSTLKKVTVRDGKLLVEVGL